MSIASRNTHDLVNQIQPHTFWLSTACAQDELEPWSGGWGATRAWAAAGAQADNVDMFKPTLGNCWDSVLGQQTHNTRNMELGHGAARHEHMATTKGHDMPTQPGLRNDRDRWLETPSSWGIQRGTQQAAAARHYSLFSLGEKLSMLTFYSRT